MSLIWGSSLRHCYYQSSAGVVVVFHGVFCWTNASHLNSVAAVCVAVSSCPWMKWRYYFGCFVGHSVKQ